MKCVIVLLALTCGALTAPIEEEAVKEFVAGNRDFTAAVYKQIAQFDRGNFIVSPMSAETVVAMAGEGARTLTGDEIMSGLHLPSTPQKIQYAFKHFVPKMMKDEDHLKLYSANRIYYGEGYKIMDSYRDVCKSVYHSDPDHVDFAQSEDAVKTINKWVLDNTKTKIRDLVHASDYDQDTKMVLVNALYFSGEWVRQFDRKNTTKRSFYNLEGDSVEVDTMYQLGEYNYYEDKSAKVQFLELPYKSGDLSMVILLPNKDQPLSNLDAIMDQLLKPKSFKKEKILMELPKFRYNGETKFVPILKNIGIKKAFDSDADFQGMTQSTTDLYISDVIQKSYISINEAGTEVSASLAVPTVPPSDPKEPIVFKVNRPFLYYISYEGVITFIGRIHRFSLDMIE